MVLSHDLTKIIPGKFKGAAFKKGHIILNEDIEELKNAGKYNVFVVPLGEEQIHENVAAGRIAEAVAGQGVLLSEAIEGRVILSSDCHGLLKVNHNTMQQINSLGHIALASIRSNTSVEKERAIAVSKAIPLTVEREIIEIAEEICRDCGPVFEVRPFHPLKTGIIVTGSEVYYGRIKDRFGEILANKISFYGGEPASNKYAPDDKDFICRLITEAIEDGCEIIIVSGGMAVDADDVTPAAIKESASEIITYGIPVSPGFMYMLAYKGQVPIVGVPACGMYHKASVFDVVFPRLLAKDKPSKEELIELAHGGLCLQCEVCRYPVCPFGK